MSEFSAEEIIKMGGEAVPVAEHDEGLRYLGYWIDAVSDWGNQVIHLQEKVRRFRAAVEPAKLTPREVIVQCSPSPSDHVLPYSGGAWGG